MCPRVTNNSGRSIVLSDHKLSGMQLAKTPPNKLISFEFSSRSAHAKYGMRAYCPSDKHVASQLALIRLQSQLPSKCQPRDALTRGRCRIPQLHMQCVSQHARTAGPPVKGAAHMNASPDSSTACRVLHQSTPCCHMHSHVYLHTLAC